MIKIKNITILIFLFLLSMLCFACTNKEEDKIELEDLVKVLNTCNISFQDEDNANSVTSDVTFNFENNNEEIIVKWVSSNLNVVSSVGKVNRFDDDIEVEVVAIVKHDNDLISKTFVLTVLGTKEEIIEDKTMRTIIEINAAANALPQGEQTENIFYTTVILKEVKDVEKGLVTTIDTDFNSLDILIVDAGDGKKLSDIIDEIDAGDVLTIKGYPQNYYGKIRLNACILISYVDGVLPVINTGDAVLVFSSGFETEDGFKAQLYGNTNKYNNKNPITVSTNGKYDERSYVFMNTDVIANKGISGDNLACCRNYKSTSTLELNAERYIQTKFTVKASFVQFDAKLTKNDVAHVSVYTSSDGTNWNLLETVDVNNTTQTYRVDMSGADVYVKFSFEFDKTPSDNLDMHFDNINFYLESGQ